jgi:hypothetical protein
MYIYIYMYIYIRMYACICLCASISEKSYIVAFCRKYTGTLTSEHLCQAPRGDMAAFALTNGTKYETYGGQVCVNIL